MAGQTRSQVGRQTEAEALVLGNIALVAGSQAAPPLPASKQRRPPGASWHRLLLTWQLVEEGLG